MSDRADQPLVIGGWTMFAHPLFLSQMRGLMDEVDALRAKDPEGYVRKNAAKRLAAIRKIILELIPADPGAPQFRQGGTLGDANKHWFRVKFFQQYRLFYRFNAKAKVIVLGWVNDDKTKRAYGKKTDAYVVFQKMLANGNPPGEWDELMSAIDEVALAKALADD